MNEDYGFYGEEENSAKGEIEGITGNVTDYTYTGLKYPCVIFKDGFKCPKHQMTVISHMINPPTRRKGLSQKPVDPSASDLESNVGLYATQQGELFKLGELKGLQMGAFLDLVGTQSVSGFYDSNTRLEEDHLYALCTV